MPREPIPLIRRGGFLEAEKLFVLSYEGKVSEKKYFEDLRHSELFNNSGLIETISLQRENNRGSDPLSVNKLLKEAKDQFNFKKTDEFWLIIDRDHWETVHHHSFDQLVKECRAENNFYLALSNPCFEIWLLLHLMPLSSFSEEEREKLLINERVSRSKTYIKKILGDLTPHGYNLKPNPGVFMPLVYVAIANAKAIDAEGESYPRGLGTHVYKLVEKLIVSK